MLCLLFPRPYKTRCGNFVLMKKIAMFWFARMAKWLAPTRLPKPASIAIPPVDKGGIKLNTPLVVQRGVFISVTLAPSKRQPIR